MDCQNCPLRDRIEQLSDQVDKLQEKYSDSRKGIYGRLEALENERGRTEEQYKSIKEDIDKLFRQYDTILSKLDELKQQPAKRWDTFVTGCISALVGGIVGFMVTKIFGGS